MLQEKTVENEFKACFLEAKPGQLLGFLTRFLDSEKGSRVEKGFMSHIKHIFNPGSKVGLEKQIEGWFMNTLQS